jgi:hypothetical protein
LAYWFNFSSVLIAFYQFFSWISLSDVDLRFSLILVTKANAVEGGEQHPHDYITLVINLYT